MSVYGTARVGLLLAALGMALVGPVAAQRATPGWIGIAYEVGETSDRVGDTMVWITDVSRGSPAETAGVRVGDRLVSINGLSGAAELKDLPARLRLRAGQQVSIRLDRDGRRVDVRLRAAERPAALTASAPAYRFQADSMAEVMFRAMDSLRVHLLGVNGGDLARQIASEVERAGALTVVSPGSRENVAAPFEFFVFRGERHDSLVREMEALNVQLEQLRRLEATRANEVQRTARSAAQDRELTELRGAIDEIARASAELRTAMAAAARATAAVEYFAPVVPNAPTEPAEPRAEAFRPLTPYLLGSNRVAGAQVVDLRPELGAYFGVDTGVLVVDVAQGTPAQIAGLLPGDVVTRIDQVGVRTVEDFRFGVAQSGDTLPVTLIRRGASLQVLLRRR